jgi:hypothetical protein
MKHAALGYPLDRNSLSAPDASLSLAHGAAAAVQPGVCGLHARIPCAGTAREGHQGRDRTKPSWSTTGTSPCLRRGVSCAGDRKATEAQKPRPDQSFAPLSLLSNPSMRPVGQAVNVASDQA